MSENARSIRGPCNALQSVLCASCRGTIDLKKGAHCNSLGQCSAPPSVYVQADGTVSTASFCKGGSHHEESLLIYHMIYCGQTSKKGGNREDRVRRDGLQPFSLGPYISYYVISEVLVKCSLYLHFLANKTNNLTKCAFKDSELCLNTC